MISDRSWADALFMSFTRTPTLAHSPLRPQPVRSFQQVLRARVGLIQLCLNLITSDLHFLHMFPKYTQPLSISSRQTRKDQYLT